MFTKLDGYTKLIANLSDKPTETASELKAYFDSSPEEIRVAFNTLIDELSAVTDGSSGADGIGATGIEGLDGETVQALLESLKGLSDDNKQYLLSQIHDIVLGQIPDGTITDVKLSDAEGQIKQTVIEHLADYVKHPGYATTTGTANTYAVILNPAPTAYVDGMGIVAKINVASTGASTINVNSLGAKTIKDPLGNDITSGGLKANTPYTLRYEATSGNFIVQGKGGGGNAQPGDVVLGKTFTNDNGQQTGTKDLSNLTSSNIKNGVTIAGIAGTYTGVVAGETLVASNDTAKGYSGTNQSSMVKLKAITVGKAGTYRVRYTNALMSTYSQIYVNGVTVGPNNHSSSSSNIIYTTDVTVNAGDSIELWGMETSIYNNSSAITNFRLYIDLGAITNTLT